jgi:prevent-host-death family protein
LRFTVVALFPEVDSETVIALIVLWALYYDHGHDNMTMHYDRREVVKEMAAGEFKAKCLAVMDEVLESGEPVLITKRGKPVAKLVAARKKSDEIFGYMTGKAKIVGDIIHSAPAEDWKSR